MRLTEKPQVILFSKEEREAMEKQQRIKEPQLARFSQELMDILTLPHEEKIIHDKWLKDGKDERKDNAPRYTRIKELVCILQGNIEGYIEFCYHPSLDRILERVMELKREIEKIDD